MSGMYRVTLGLETAEVSTPLARAQWDLTPEDLRSGSRDGAFILWQLDHRGFRTAPVIFKPCEEATCG